MEDPRSRPHGCGDIGRELEAVLAGDHVEAGVLSAWQQFQNSTASQQEVQTAWAWRARLVSIWSAGGAGGLTRNGSAQIWLNTRVLTLGKHNEREGSRVLLEACARQLSCILTWLHMPEA